MAKNSSQLTGPIELLKESWEVYQSKFVVLVLLTFFMSLPGLITSFTGIATANPSIAMAIILFLLSLIFSTLGTAAMIFVIKDKNLGFTESLKTGLTKFVPLFLLQILLFLIIAGGLILLIIPGIMFMVWFSFSEFVLINENSSVIQSLSKSKQYVKGHWWAVFGRFIVLLLVGILFGIPSAVLGRIGAGEAAVEMVNTAVSAILTPIITIYSFLLYTNLKSLKS